MKFKSAVDTWFYILVAGLPVVVLVLVASAGTGTVSEMAIIAIVLVVTMGLPVWLLFSTYYVVESGVLLVRSGPFRWSIPISDITSVQPSRSLLSSPALSLKRLEIRYGNGRSILVSPKDQAGFQKALLGT
jgi:hypothetical protein